ncbi:MAG: DsrE family protein [Actinobacteria bacterium]|nr:DsrE family protein [Actinomycetota bacterium]MCA1722356.1 DsrE family protein [Actinomycetota bacterium]
MAADDKVIISLTHGLDDAESVLISYLMGVEALRKGKQVLMWLTKDGIHVATVGYAATVVVPDAPDVGALHEEYVASGGRFYACPVCVKTRGLQDAEWASTAEVKGAPSVYEFAEGGALTFSY